MVSMIDIKNEIKEPTCGYQNFGYKQILKLGGNVKVRESLYTQLIICASTILNHIETRYEGSCIVYIVLNTVHTWPIGHSSAQ